MMQSMAQSFASVAEPPFPKIISLPPRSIRSRMASAGSDDFLRFFFCYLRAQKGIITHLHSNGRGNLGDNIKRFLLVFAEKRVQESGFANVMAQFAVFEKNVNGFPKRVIQDFDQFLVKKGSCVPGCAK